jgi:hypothetical protein
VSQTAKLHVERRVPAAGAMSRNIKDFQVPSVENPDGTISPVAQVIIPLDVNTEPNTYTMPCTIQDKATGNFLGVASPLANMTASSYAIATRSQLFVSPWPSASEPLRTPTTYKFATCAAATGATVIWAPAAGKKFRLMGLIICPSGTAAAAGLRTFSIEEETLGQIMAASVIAPAAGVGCNAPIVIDLPGNGYLATLADKDLIITTGTTAYTVGSDAVTAWGTEE